MIYAGRPGRNQCRHDLGQQSTLYVVCVMIYVRFTAKIHEICSVGGTVPIGDMIYGTAHTYSVDPEPVTNKYSGHAVGDGIPDLETR